MKGSAKLALALTLFVMLDAGDPHFGRTRVDPLGPRSQGSDDAGVIVFIRDGDAWLILPDATGETRLTETGTLLEVALSPDGTTAAYIEEVRSTDPPAERMGLLDVQTLKKWVLVPPQGTCWPCGTGDLYNSFFYWYSNPVWSSDGTSIYFGTSGGPRSADSLRTVDVETGSWDIPPDQLHAGGGARFDVSSSSGEVVFPLWGGTEMILATSSGIQEFRRGEWTKLMEENLPVELGDVCWLGPSGTAIFTRFVSLASTSSLHWIDTRSGSEGTLVTGLRGSVDVACSPDGDSIVYSADGTLWIYGVPTGQARRLIAGSKPHWGRALGSQPQLGPEDEGGCGRWLQEGPYQAKDLRIQVTRTEKNSTEGCSGYFRLSNDTDISGTGGYAFQLQVRSENASVEWQPSLWISLTEGLTLVPGLDLELEATVLDISSEAKVFIRGESNLDTFSKDLALFLLRAAFAFAPPGVDCIVPKEELAFIAMQVSPIVEGSAEHILRGDLVGSWLALKGVVEEFYRRSSDLLFQAGESCASDILVYFAGTPGIVYKIARAYLSWIQVWLMDYLLWYQGEPVELTFAYTPAENYSFDIVFVGDDGNLWILTGDGAMKKPLTGGGGYTEPAWSPDGAHIAAVSSASGNRDIVVIDTATGAETRLTDDLADEISPTWSPDGALIAFLHDALGGGLSMLNVGGNELEFLPTFVRVIDSSGENEAEEIVNPYPGSLPDIACCLSWSPTGATIAIAGVRGTGHFWSIEQIDAATGLPPYGWWESGPGDWAVAFQTSPNWSIDGEWVAFSRIYDAAPREGVENNRPDLYIMKADGSEARMIVENGIQPSWSPDGTKLVYSNNAGIWRIDLDERGDPIFLSRGHSPDWRRN